MMIDMMMATMTNTTPLGIRGLLGLRSIGALHKSPSEPGEYGFVLLWYSSRLLRPSLS